MAKFVVTCDAIWVDAPSGRDRDSRKSRGAIVELKAGEAKAHVEAGRLEAIKAPRKKKAKE